MNAHPRIAAVPSSLQRLSRPERVALVAGACIAAVQLLALAQLSRESVLKGERLRAGQVAQVAAHEVN